MAKASSEVKRRYNTKAYDQVNIAIPKGRREDIQKWAKENGVSVNGFVNEALRRALGMSEEEWKRRPPQEQA